MYEMHSMGAILDRGEVPVERSLHRVAQSARDVAVHIGERLDEALRMPTRQPYVRLRPLGQFSSGTKQDLLRTVRCQDSQPVRIFLRPVESALGPVDTKAKVVALTC